MAPDDNLLEWALNSITKMRVSAVALDDTSSIVSRTVLVYSQSFKIRGTWVLQPVAEVSLTDVLVDPALRDIFWCQCSPQIYAQTVPHDPLCRGHAGIDGDPGTDESGMVFWEKHVFSF